MSETNEESVFQVIEEIPDPVVPTLDLTSEQNIINVLNDIKKLMVGPKKDYVNLGLDIAINAVKMEISKKQAVFDLAKEASLE